MAEVVYKSAGIYATEIDLSQPTARKPSGTPAGVIGTSNQGPAFIPVTIGSYEDFARVFGATDGEKFGPLAVYEFLKNAQALTYLRVLGAGDGNKRSGDTGKVTNAGFTVGQSLPLGTGIYGDNPYAVADGDTGRTYFLGCFMSESAGSRIFTSAGISRLHSASSIVRGVLLAASGVILTLSGNNSPAGAAGQPSNTVAATAGATTLKGGMTGSVRISDGQFTLLLNGHVNTDLYPNTLTASFVTTENSYFGKVFNTDPLKLQKAGHILYAQYDINSAYAHITGSGILSGSRHATGQHLLGTSEELQDIGFLLTGSNARDTATGIAPNYESFNDRFTHAKTPFFISQDFGGTKYDLFRVHSLDDGSYANDLIKISIQSIKPSTSDTDKFGRFDLLVRRFDDQDHKVIALEKHLGLTLDPSSDKYVARVIGDQNIYFDFDQAAGSQKIVVSGDHPGSSTLIRVEMSTTLKNGQVPDAALPLGHRGPDHLVTSGSGPLACFPQVRTAKAGIHRSTGFITTPSAPKLLKEAVTTPVDYREDIMMGISPDIKPGSWLYWGTRFDERIPDVLVDRTGEESKVLRTLNSPTISDKTIAKARVKYFPSFNPGTFNFAVGNNPGKADSGGTVLDCDKFNKNIFTLERIRVRTGSDGIADTSEWASSSYVRGGAISTDHSTKTRALKVSDLKTQGNRKYAKFTVFLQGGFNGTNIFDKNKSELLNTACKWEMDDSTNQGGVQGPTVSTYRKAIDIMGTKADADINLLAIPGLRHTSVTDYAIDAIESRFDSMYIMDIESRDTSNTVITASVDSDGEPITPNVKNTVAGFLARSVNTSFAAAYFPDIVITDPTTKTNVTVPPSVSVLGAMSLNDAVSHPWFAPAGFTRGALGSALYAARPLNKTNLDDLYEAKINPIVSFTNGKGLVVWGQKTLFQNASALDRVNVRRLLINIRRQVKNIANSMLFEPNRQETLDRFNSLVKPVMQRVQEQQGVDKYKVIIDTTTTTQLDIENNTLRGKIFLQPTRTAEFIALDFVVANSDNFDDA